jgi:hypothetical protein
MGVSSPCFSGVTIRISSIEEFIPKAISNALSPPIYRFLISAFLTQSLMIDR